MFKVDNKDTRMTPMACSSAFIVNFEQVNAGWAVFYRTVGGGEVGGVRHSDGLNARTANKNPLTHLLQGNILFNNKMTRESLDLSLLFYG